MSRRGRGGAVRGPASALTSFLAVSHSQLYSTPADSTQGLGVEPPTRLTTWGPAIPTGDNANAQQPSLAPDGPVISDGDELDPAGAVTARTVEAGPSIVGEGTPDEDTEAGQVSRSSRYELTTRTMIQRMEVPLASDPR